MAEGHNLTINGDRLWDSLMEMAKIGATEKGGNCRLALTDLDREGRDLFVRWCEEAGCSIRIDRMGNIFARRPGRDDSLAPVMTGSHLDTQPTGGRFDGVYGVLAGLEVVRSLNDMNIETERPVEVAVWTNEEGSRFAPSMIASAVFAGVYDLDFGLACADEDGKTIGEELERIGYAGDSDCGGQEIHAFFETHIEQGPILEDEGITIGVVTGAQGQKWYELEIEGQESHAGPTPMPVRRDALLGASRVVELVNQIGLAHAPGACATVGMLNVHPNSRNVIPGRVFMTIDFRHPDPTALATMDQTMRAGVAEIAERSRVEIGVKQIMDLEPLPFDEACVASVQKGADDIGYSSRRIVSGAGHDACNIARVAPTSMIFIPCIDGISHNEVEDAKPEWIHAGGNVLLRAMLERAG
ncbi:MAG: Zn-dependent hydrolase [Minwuia sp.]|uniref:Zn-dependent hydrolase n=1 Tax=Minwuia sp. TaxID=2493630 RepID=UPI003A8A2E5C